MKYLILIFVVVLFFGGCKKNSEQSSNQNAKDTSSEKKDTKSEKASDSLGIQIIINPNLTCKTTKAKISKISKNKAYRIKISYPVISGLDNKVVTDKINQYLFKEFTTKDDKSLITSDNIERIGEEMKKDKSLLKTEIDYEITLSENGVLSFLCSGYDELTPSAHPSTEQRTYNINLNNGELIVLKDIFVAKSSYLPIIEDKIKDKADKDGLGSFNKKETYDFLITKRILIIKNIFEGALSAFDVEIPLEDLENVLLANFRYNSTHNK